MIRDRYAKFRKVERNQRLYQYAKDHPDVSYEEIGKLFDGISKQRVSELIANEEKKKATEAEPSVA